MKNFKCLMIISLFLCNCQNNFETDQHLISKIDQILVISERYDVKNDEFYQFLKNSKAEIISGTISDLNKKKILEANIDDFISGLEETQKANLEQIEYSKIESQILKELKKAKSKTEIDSIQQKYSEYIKFLPKSKVQ